MITKIFNSVITTSINHGLSTGTLVRISNTGMGINGHNYYVKVLSLRSFSLYADTSLTIPLGGMANFATSTISVIPLNQTSITYSAFPPKWSAVDWPVTWINSSSVSSSGSVYQICGTAVESSSVSLTAPPGSTFTSVEFASYGTPTGTCGSFAIGGCHASNSLSIVKNYVLGRSGTITIPATNEVFGDPCIGTAKQLYVQATAIATSTTTRSESTSTLVWTNSGSAITWKNTL
jgi:hypothetical protein